MKRFLIAILGTAVMFATVANAATLVATTDSDGSIAFVASSRPPSPTS